MTLSEFKAWLDGFSAAIDGAPSPEQWAAIRAKLDTVQASDLWPNPYPPVTLPGTIYGPRYGAGSGDVPWWLGTVTCRNTDYMTWENSYEH